MKTYKDILKEQNQKLFDIDSADEFVAKLEKGIKAPFVKAQKSTLGGPQNVSVMMRLSLDPKDTWVNNIFENSRFMHFRFDSRDNSFEQFTKSHTIKKKFRKARAKSMDEAIKKINKYIDQVK